LTDVGATFYQSCARIIAEAEEAELAVTRLQTVPRGTLRISAPVSFGVQHLAPAIAEFLGHWPDLTVDMVLNDRLVDLVEEGYDMAIRIGRLADSSLIAKRLCPMPVTIVASPGYLAGHPAPLVPHDLTQHNCLLYSLLSTGDTWHFRDTEKRDIAVPVTGNLRANNGEVLFAAARAGLGIAALPVFMCGRAVHDGTMVEVLSDFRDLGLSVHAVYPHARHLSTKVRAFVDFLTERFTAAPWDKRCQEAAAGGH
jgi:DNA-binding transcriptional LysR family regulator